MILVLGGTSEGREITKALTRRGYKVLASTATAYGGLLLEGCGAGVRTGKLDEAELVRLIREEGIELVVDATHPYAEVATKTAGIACREAGTGYLRYQRPVWNIPHHPLVFWAGDYSGAARRAVEIAGRDGVVFLTTGSKTLATFMDPAREIGCRVVARILPDDQVMRRCLALGLTPSDIVAMKGPFTKELNTALLKHFGASVLVTKESGNAGGTEEKLAAALELEVPVVVVKRPSAPEGFFGDMDSLMDAIDDFFK